MRFQVECWNTACKNRFHAHDELPAAHDYRCPRCGMYSLKVIFTKKQVKAHTPYRHVGEGQVVRVGLERRYFGSQGLYIRDRVRRIIQRYDQVVVNGSIPSSR